MIIWDLVCYFKNTRIVSLFYCILCHRCTLLFYQATFMDLTIAAWNGFWDDLHEAYFSPLYWSCNQILGILLERTFFLVALNYKNLNQMHPLNSKVKGVGHLIKVMMFCLKSTGTLVEKQVKLRLTTTSHAKTALSKTGLFNLLILVNWLKQLIIVITLLYPEA